MGRGHSHIKLFSSNQDQNLCVARIKLIKELIMTVCNPEKWLDLALNAIEMFIAHVNGTKMCFGQHFGPVVKKY